VARRDLSRTVIEGGRTRRSQYERRQSHRHVRAAERTLLRAALFDDEDALDKRPPPRLEPAYKIFRDRLGAAKRWLTSQCGRPWDHVYSELRRRFDSRTIAGKHVVDDHLLGWVALHREGLVSRYFRPDFVVDEHGILRRWRDLYARELAIRDRLAGAGGRRAVPTSRGWWWFTGATINGVAQRRWFAPREPLTPRQVELIRALPPWLQHGLVWRLPERAIDWSGARPHHGPG
jgi:hypothetical protein